ncbi:CYP3A4 (predicted) [Pycnogonum litorale]
MEVLGVLSLPSWFVYFSCVCLLIFLHYVWNFCYWKWRGIPGPTPYPLIGRISPLLRGEPVHVFDKRNFDKYGRVYGDYEFSKRVLSIGDPELLKCILVKDFDVFRNRKDWETADDILQNGLFNQKDLAWKESRRVMSPMFSSGKMKNMLRLINTCVESMMEKFTEKAKDREAFDCKSIFGRFTMDSIAQCAFGIDIDAQNDANGDFVQNAVKIFDLKPWRMYMNLLFPSFAKLFNVQLLDPNVVNYFRKTIRKVIETRKSGEINRPDFMQLVVDAMSDGTHDFTEDYVLVQAVFFFTVGYDTTTNGLASIAYNLALNPECQDKAIEEIDKVLEKHEKIDYDSVQEMPYLQAVINESLRLFPPGSRIEKVCGRNFQLGDIYVPKGTFVLYSIYSLHRDPEFWPDPDVFKPERFLEDEIKPYAYIPFGEGPRNCIAKRFALIEIKMAMASILSKLKFKKTSETQKVTFKTGTDITSFERVDLTMEMR